jgi:hypothetical protein
VLGCHHSMPVVGAGSAEHSRDEDVGYGADPSAPERPRSPQHRGFQPRSPVDRARSQLLADLVALTADHDWLVTQRALDLLEKLAHEHPKWVAPHKKVFIGPLAESDKWEIRLQIVRAVPLFHWTAAQARRVEQILLENVAFPQTFVRAWALDSLATLAKRRPSLMPVVLRRLREFERSPSKALRARARHIRARLAASRPPRSSAGSSLLRRRVLRQHG